jgi:hypothetical protein
MRDANGPDGVRGELHPTLEDWHGTEVPPLPRVIAGEVRCRSREDPGPPFTVLRVYEDRGAGRAALMFGPSVDGLCGEMPMASWPASSILESWPHVLVAAGQADEQGRTLRPFVGPHDWAERALASGRSAYVGSHGAELDPIDGSARLERVRVVEVLPPILARGPIWVRTVPWSLSGMLPAPEAISYEEVHRDASPPPPPMLQGVPGFFGEVGDGLEGPPFAPTVDDPICIAVEPRTRPRESNPARAFLIEVLDAFAERDTLRMRVRHLEAEQEALSDILFTVEALVRARAASAGLGALVRLQAVLESSEGVETAYRALMAQRGAELHLPAAPTVRP